MDSLIFLIAAVGVGALVSRLLRMMLRLGLRAAEVTATSGLAEISARQGDLTSLAERRAALARARRQARRDLLLSLLWLAWLVVPAFAPWTREAYALAAPLWLLPRPSLPVVRK